ncbi:hypothetical protein [Pedobacter agri]|uniref:hypothetical protein n=1 Tax=Pedobacter agri TaxID=454586 RepID=UPI00292EE5EB|nr:hypothetical protein [Pedobacter agri]
MENINNPEEDEGTVQENKDQVKTGVIPNNDLDGSDADKAYDENGEFKQLGENQVDQNGADADEDKKSK